MSILLLGNFAIVIESIAPVSQSIKKYKICVTFVKIGYGEGEEIGWEAARRGKG